MSNGTKQYIYKRPLTGAKLNVSSPFSNKIVGFWLLNENGRVAYDLSGRNNKGTLTGFTAPPTRNSFGTTFNETTTDYITIPNQVIIPNVYTSYTICSWYRTTFTGLTNSLFGECSTASTNPIVRLAVNGTAAGDVAFGCRGATATGTVTSSNVNSNDGKWHSVVGIQRATNSRELYFDGQLVGTNTTEVGDVASNNSKIGAQERTLGPENYFTGIIGYVLIYRRALSSNEVIQLYINPYKMLSY